MRTLEALAFLAQRLLTSIDRVEHKLDVLLRIMQESNQADGKYSPPVDQLSYARVCPVCARLIQYVPSEEGPVRVTIRQCGCVTTPPQVGIKDEGVK